MKYQGYSLGKQLAEHFGRDVSRLCRYAKEMGVRIWFLGRDCDVFYGAYAPGSRQTVRYITGLNRENARRLQHRRRLVKWLKSFGVAAGDILVDSGYSGSIYSRIEHDDPVFFGSIRCVLITANPAGFTGEPLSPESIAGSKSKLRHIMLALEHSPKREEISWDEIRRVPKVSKAEGVQLARATAFYEGCVLAIQKGDAIV